MNEQWKKAVTQSRRIGKTTTKEGKKRSVHRWAELTLKAIGK